MEEENLKKYLESINKMIKSGNPKYMSFISREYMKYMKNSPVIADAISDMIYKETVRNEKSPYAIFVHDNGSICLDAISDVSKLTNIAEFVGHVEELSKYDIDFSTVTPDDLITEADKMIEELERELEKEEITEQDIEKTEEKAETSLVKIGFLATLGGAIGGAASALLSKMKTKMASLKSQKGQTKTQNVQQPDNTKQAMTKEQVAASRLSFEQVCPKVEINEKEVLGNMKNKNEKVDELAKKKNTDTYGDGDPDGDDLDI